MARYRVTVTGHDNEAMADLVRTFHVEVVRHTTQRTAAGEFQISALLDESQIPILEKAGYQIARHEDVDAAGKLRQAEVGQGNRYLKQ